MAGKHTLTQKIEISERQRSELTYYSVCGARF